MRDKVDVTNLENALKYFQYVDNSTNTKDGQVIENDMFYEVSVDTTDNLILWERNKAHIYELFNKNLKIEKTLDPDSVFSAPMVRQTVSEFLKENHKNFNYLVLVFLNSLTGKEIFDNQISEDKTILGAKMKKGWKVSKCLSVLEPNKKSLQKQQDLLSVMIQSLKLQGRLVLSIDPLDYLTMSVSKSGWSSCHHPGSCHGTGGLAYMTDPATIIAYVETSNPIVNEVVSKDGEEKSEVRFVNKIWRQIININPNHDYMLQLKGYPNNSELYSQLASELLIDLLTKEQGTEFCSLQGGDNPTVNSSALKGNSDLEGQVFYCDFLNGNMSHPNLIIRSNAGVPIDLEKGLSKNKIKPIIVGNSFYCACGCGNINYSNRLFLEEAYDDDFFY